LNCRCTKQLCGPFSESGSIQIARRVPCMQIMSGRIVAYCIAAVGVAAVAAFFGLTKKSIPHKPRVVRGADGSLPNNVHVALLGDSIFDNQIYVKHYNKCVPGALEARLKNIHPDWKVTLLARDGAVAAHIEEQITKVDPSMTHIFVSIIGNDCLRELGSLTFSPEWQNLQRNPTAENPVLAKILSQLVTKYDRALKQIVQLGLPVVACNLYAPRFTEGATQLFSAAAVQLVNNKLREVATKYGVDVIDIHNLFTEPEDYANPIEPGHQGSVKIATAIESVLMRSLHP